MGGTWKGTGDTGHPWTLRFDWKVHQVSSLLGSPLEAEAVGLREVAERVWRLSQDLQESSQVWLGGRTLAQGARGPGFYPQHTKHKW